MDIRRISGIVLVLIAVLLALEYFKIFSLGLPFLMIGALVLIAHQGWALIRNVTSGVRIMGIIIPLLLGSIGVLYFFPLPFVPSIVISNLSIVIALVLLLEGLYSLH